MLASDTGSPISLNTTPEQGNAAGALGADAQHKNRSDSSNENSLTPQRTWNLCFPAIPAQFCAFSIHCQVAFPNVGICNSLPREVACCMLHFPTWSGGLAVLCSVVLWSCGPCSRPVWLPSRSVPLSFYLLKRLAACLRRPNCADERGQRQKTDQQRANETYSAFG